MLGYGTPYSHSYCTLTRTLVVAMVRALYPLSARPIYTHAQHGEFAFEIKPVHFSYFSFFLVFVHFTLFSYIVQFLAS